MQFLFHGRPRPELRSSPDAESAIAREQAKVRDLYGRGVFRQVWMTESGVVAICEAETREDMESHISRMPLLQAGFMDVELQDLKPFRGFAPE